MHGKQGEPISLQILRATAGTRELEVYYKLSPKGNDLHDCDRWEFPHNNAVIISLCVVPVSAAANMISRAVPDIREGRTTHSETSIGESAWRMLD